MLELCVSMHSATDDCQTRSIRIIVVASVAQLATNKMSSTYTMCVNICATPALFLGVRPSGSVSYAGNFTPKPRPSHSATLGPSAAFSTIFHKWGLSPRPRPMRTDDPSHRIQRGFKACRSCNASSRRPL